MRDFENVNIKEIIEEVLKEQKEKEKEEERTITVIFEMIGEGKQ